MVRKSSIFFLTLVDKFQTTISGSTIFILFFLMRNECICKNVQMWHKWREYNKSKTTQLAKCHKSPLLFYKATKKSEKLHHLHPSPCLEKAGNGTKGSFVRDLYFNYIQNLLCYMDHKERERFWSIQTSCVNERLSFSYQSNMSLQ